MESKGFPGRRVWLGQPQRRNCEVWTLSCLASLTGTQRSYPHLHPTPMGRVKAQSILALRLHELRPALGLELVQGNPTL